MNRFNQVTTAIIAGALFSASPVHAGSTSLYAGADRNQSGTTLYAGAIVALNGDLSKDGYLFKVNASGTAYEYDTVTYPQGVNGDARRLEFSIGHQWITDKTRLSAYIGAERQEHSLSPDDTANLSRGTETGYAVQVEASNDNAPYDLGFIGSYTNANESYFSRVRVGRMMDSNTLGLEAYANGSESYDEKRIGAYYTMPISGHTKVTFSFGRSDSHGKDSVQDAEGLYLQFGVSDQF